MKWKGLYFWHIVGSWLRIATNLICFYDTWTANGLET